MELPPERLEELLESCSEEPGGFVVLEAEAEVGLPFRRDLVRVVAPAVDPKGSFGLPSLPVERLARMAVVARGRHGTGVDFLRELNAKLHEWGLEDPAVAALWKEVQKERGEGWR
jgi:cation transport regulator ChaC